MKFLTDSLGFKRALSIVLLLAAQIPQLAPYQDLLTAIGGLFGVAGVAHATLSK